MPDKLVLAAYAESLQQALFSLNADAHKNDKAVLQTGLLKGYTVETWIAFLNSDETGAADSVYTGSIVYKNTA